MWGQRTEEAFRRQATDTNLPEHRQRRPPSEDDGTSQSDRDRDLDISNLTTELPSPHEQDRSTATLDGTWGEREMGGPVSQRAAMQDFDHLRNELTRLNKTHSRAASTRSKKSTATAATGASNRRPSFFGRIASRATTTRSAAAGPSGNQQQRDHDEESEIGMDDDKSSNGSDEDDFQLEQFMRDGHLERRDEAGEPTKRVGVVFKNLTVKGVAGGATLVRTLPEAIMGTFGPDLYRNIGRFFPSLQFRRKSPKLRELIHDFTGVIRPGEMMLVLGRPGSGCSTFLKVVTNNRGGYASVEGDVSYSGIPADEISKKYRGEVVYNAEDDQHMPTLTVGQTLKFALLNKTRKNLRGDVELIIDSLLRMFAIKHTFNTLVGNEYTRGVSGGERKRVSIAETLATKSSVVAWDNSTRGLDASTALDYAKSLRIMTDVSDRTTITTLYQAGEGIYELMDKVLVIDQGRMLYQGPASAARQYFIDLGFYAPPRQTTPDFLTSLCDPISRQFREDVDIASIPKTAEELEAAFRASSQYKTVLAEVAEFEQHLHATEHADAKQFQKSVELSKSKRVQASSNYTVPLWKQVLACARRELWLIWGDKTELYTKYFIIVSIALVISSLFYKIPEDTSGSFLRTGAVFFSLIFLGWMQMAELMKAVSGRVVVARHEQYAFYRPSAVVLGRVLTDIPLLLPQVAVFGIVMYFMADLDLGQNGGKFFIYLLMVYTMTFCFTALYRMFAALSPTIDDAVRFSGLALNVLIIYVGYVITKPIMLTQKIWFGWLYYVSPISYAFEAVVSNEFANRRLECSPSMLVPQGPGISRENQGCAIPGATPGSNGVSGDVYIASAYDYSRDNLWRNFGIVLAFTVFYILVTVVATEKLRFGGSGPGALVFKKSNKTKKQVALAAASSDEEKGSGNVSSSDETLNRSKTQDEALGSLERSDRIFTWENVSYTVPTPQGPKKLLNDVTGYAKPGVMVALVGASGAGKTTLLNTLSQRQTVGVVTGDMLVDGAPLSTDFQRSTGFVEQMDLHEPTSTIREALEFSALLRQSRDTPRHEKLEYVDKIIDLLELNDIQDAVVASLGVEHKKRLTIGVELAAKPSLLLFLDEPTSGLDSQSAFSIVRFLRKLCAAGQAVVCTIHQPSSDLIQQFDKILALNPGGNVFYFGPVGENGADVVKYFADRGVDCPPGKNVAEFILETAAKVGRGKNGKKINWDHEWRNSEQKKALVEEVQRIKAERSASVKTETTGSNQSATTKHAFAAPIMQQTVLLTKRMFVRQWRDPSYMYGRLFVSVLVGIFNGFTFWQLGNTVADMQNAMFTNFLIIMLPSAVLNAVLPKFYTNRALWEKREYPSRIYGWVAFCTAEILSEIPGSLIAGLLYWILWYLPTGLPYDSPTAGYMFLMVELFFLFQSSWGQWVCAFAPSFTVTSNVLPFFLVMFSLFNGVVVPYEQLNVFWRYWLYWLNPSTYWIAGALSATMPDRAVVCDPQEAAYFNPPSGQTCLDFAGDFVRQAGQGYLTNPNDTTNCGYCPYSSGQEYLTRINVFPDDKWRNFGIFLAFCVSNWALVYFFIYTVRIKKWTFGFGPFFSGLGKIAGAVKGLFFKKDGEKKEEN